MTRFTLASSAFVAACSLTIFGICGDLDALTRFSVLLGASFGAILTYILAGDHN